MAFDYAGLRDGTVKNLLNEFGQDVTVKVWSEGSYDASTGTATPSYTNKTARAAIFDFKADEIDGTQVQLGDKKALINPKDTSGSTFSMSTNDRLTVGGNEHEVVSLESLSPAGTTVLYKAQVRGV